MIVDDVGEEGLFDSRMYRDEGLSIKQKVLKWESRKWDDGSPRTEIYKQKRNHSPNLSFNYETKAGDIINSFVCSDVFSFIFLRHQTYPRGTFLYVSVKHICQWNGNENNLK